MVEVKVNVRVRVRLRVRVNVRAETCGFYSLKALKSAQNRPYLSLQLLPNCSHQKSFTPYIVQYIRLKFEIWLLN